MKSEKTDRLLLDTCAVIWTALDAGIDKQAEEAMNASVEQGVDVMVSPISAWELGLLSARRRLPSAQNPATLFEEYIQRPGIGLDVLTPSILIDSSFLPGDFHSDPVDRIIVATARALERTIVTRDRAILDYARQGYVLALEC
jgi:PIN domain nuclease of toxin-antitoxin system